VLIERNFIPRDEMSMQRIRDWMAANRDAGRRRCGHQPLVRILPHHRPVERGEPLGAQGVR